MSTYILDEAVEAVGGSSDSASASDHEGDYSDEIPVLHTPVVRPRKRRHTEENGSQENSKLRSKKKSKRVTRALNSDSEESDHETEKGEQEINSDCNDMSMDKQPQTRSEMILNELKKTNQLLHTISKRVEKNEHRIKKVEKQHSSPLSTPKSSRSKDVPQEVRVSYS